MATEDFTTYTEVDPNSHITVASSSIDANVLEDEDAYVYDDKGASHFGSTWDHDIDFTRDDIASGNVVAGWGVSNALNDWKGLWDVGAQAIFQDIYNGILNINDAETGDYDSGDSIANGTTRYLTVERTGETAVDMRIYSDSGRTTLVDTLSITITSGRRYRYIFGVNTWNDGGTGHSYCTTANLNLNEAGAGPTVPLMEYHYRHQRCR